MYNKPLYTGTLKWVTGPVSRVLHITAGWGLQSRNVNILNRGQSMSASTVGSATKIGTKIGSAACASTSASSPANVVVASTKMRAQLEMRQMCRR